MKKCLKWAKSFINITEIEMRTILHARRSVLFDNNHTTWIKKDTKKQFDVTMGAYDGAEVCELVGIYILYALGKKLKLHSVGLYRDDDLAILEQ